MKQSRLEINVRRLLAKCELIAKDNSEDDWRLEKFIGRLDEMVAELQKIPNKPSKDTLSTYYRRIDFLKGLLDTKKIVSPSEKVVATQLLCPVPESIAKEVHQKTATKYTKELRDQLLTSEKGTDLRQRHPASPGDDLDVLLKYHHSMQEKIADNMLVLARNMKEQSKLAGSIIRKDTETVEKSSRLADKNFLQLRVEADKLQEHSHRAWKCWMWLMLAAVIVIFINMVLFMKVAKKKKF